MSGDDSDGSTSAVVVAYNSTGQLPTCLAAIRRVASLKEVIVVDHGDDGSADLAASLGARVRQDPTNPGFGTGQNRGVALTTGDYLLLVNPDAVIEPLGIEEGLTVLQNDPKIAAVQGVIRNAATGQPERSQGVALGPLHLFGRAMGARRLLRFKALRGVAGRTPVIADHVHRVPEGPTEVESLAATALLIRRSAFESVNGFDESYFLYSEDLDLCRRLRSMGWRLVALPVEWAVHTSGSSSAGWWERELVWWEGTLRYAARWWQAPAWQCAQLAANLRLVPMAVSRPRRTGDLIRRLVVAPRNARRHR